MTGVKKTPLGSSNSSSYNVMYLNPLNNDPADKENTVPAVSPTGCRVRLASSASCKLNSTEMVGGGLKPSKKQSKEIQKKPCSLQLRMRLDEPVLTVVPSPVTRDPHSSSADVWDFSDSEAAPASSWSTLPNRSLLCRPLPIDVGRCTCIITKGVAEGLKGVNVYSLYTNEGQGRQDRKLAVGHHRRRNGRSEFIIAQDPRSIFCSSDEGFLGTITANLMGSKYQIWDQGNSLSSLKSQSKRLLGVIMFAPTANTLAGSFRSMRAWIPKQNSVQLKNTGITKIQHVSGLPRDWKEKRNKALQLNSKIPYYNHMTKRYELDFRERVGKNTPKIRRSAKNFQLTMEDKGRQTILQLGRIGKSQYIMDYRYPLTGYQAFCICLASVDSKLCCSV